MEDTKQSSIHRQRNDQLAPSFSKEDIKMQNKQSINKRNKLQTNKNTQ